MKFIKPVFYTLIALACLYLVYAIYMSTGRENAGAGFGISVMFILSAITVGVAIFFPIAYMVSHPKSAIPALIGIGVILLVFGLGYALSGDEITLAYERVKFTSPGASKLVGGALKMMYIMIAGVLGVTVFSEVRKFFK